MSPDHETPPYGTVGWIDLTVDDVAAARDFYVDVVGWTVEPVDMGGYEDFSMNAADGTASAGVCARRGVNAEQPSGWIPYFVVRDLDACLARCAERGARVLRAPRGEGARFAVVEDPWGARCALYQP